METDGLEELGKHLESFINDVDTNEDKQNKEISFGGDHSPLLHELLLRKTFVPPTYLTFFGPPSGFPFHQPRATQLIPCLMPWMNLLPK